MGIELASRATIVISVLTLGYNLYHLGNAYAYTRLQFQGFRNALAEEAYDPTRARRLNYLLMAALPLSYVGLLYWAGFAWWLLGLVATKYLFSGVLSDFFQTRVLQGRGLRRRHCRLFKVDAFLNVLVIALILIVSVV